MYKCVKRKQNHKHQHQQQSQNKQKRDPASKTTKHNHETRKHNHDTRKQRRKPSQYKNNHKDKDIPSHPHPNQTHEGAVVVFFVFF
jgi:hypothetical protein